MNPKKFYAFFPEELRNKILNCEITGKPLNYEAIRNIANNLEQADNFAHLIQEEAGIPILFRGYVTQF